jgi:aminoglycoside phosphotransferase (APT) family kinase protein
MDVGPEEILVAAGLSWQSCTPIAGGLQHELYRVALTEGGHCVLKMGRSDQEFGDSWEPARTHEDGLRAEQQALGYLRNHLPVPTPYRVVDSEHPAALMGFLRGDSAQTMWEKGRVSSRHLETLCFAMGQALAQVHRVRRPSDPGAIPDLPGAPWDDARLLHMDFHLGNVMVKRAGLKGWQVLGLVDWVLCRWGPREADLVEMSLSVFRQAPSSRSAFLGGYRRGGGAPLSQDREEYWLRHELKRRLESGVDDPRLRARWELWEQELRGSGSG